MKSASPTACFDSCITLPFVSEPAAYQLPAAGGIGAIVLTLSRLACAVDQRIPVDSHDKRRGTRPLIGPPSIVPTGWNTMKMPRVSEYSNDVADADQMLRNKKRLWTGEDDQRLLALAAAGRSNLSIAAAMKRSKGAVSSRLSILRLRTNNGGSTSPARSPNEGL